MVPNESCEKLGNKTKQEGKGYKGRKQKIKGKQVTSFEDK